MKFFNKSILNNLRKHGQDSREFGINDIGKKNLKYVLSVSKYANTLKTLIEISRTRFGWFAKHLPRSFEYPWVINKLKDVNEQKILDIGAGVSPIPIYLAEKGSFVFTVDPHSIIRKIEENTKSWNEWGFLDYSQINSSIKSFNESIESMTFQNEFFDIIYSISVIEHFPASLRRKTWILVSKWLKNNGKLILTIDLKPESKILWNYSEGKIVEDEITHGDLDEIIHEIEILDFKLKTVEFLKKIPESRVDCALLMFIKI